MPRNSKDFTYDHQLLMKAAGLVAATTAHTILDLGPARMDGRVILDASAIEVDSGNELYTIELQVSNSATFASGIFVAGRIAFGHSSTTFESANTAIGRRELAFTNEINGVVYRYARLNTRVAGTIATGINYVGFIVQHAN